jgi:phage terminase large subunit-like protein
MSTVPAFDIKLHPKQAEVYLDKSRFKVMVCGRRFGKTVLCLIEILSQALGKPNQVIWYVAPTYKQAKRLMWDELKKQVPEKFVKKTYEVELRMILKNGSEISLFGVDKPDGLRGSKLDLLCMDEYQDFRPGIFEMVLYPTLADKRGRVVVAGTPKSYNLLYELYARGIDDVWKKRGWRSWSFKTLDNPFIPKDEIENARLNLRAGIRSFI